MKLREVKDNLVYWDCVFDTIAYYRLLYFKLDLREVLPKEVSSLIGFSSIRICKDILEEELDEVKRD